MPGYRSKQMMSQGSFYAPYVPSKMSPASALHEMHKKYVLWRASFSEETDHMQQVTEVMQKHFPGPYVIEEHYNSTRGCFELRFVFKDPKQETMWKLKYP